MYKSAILFIVLILNYPAYSFAVEPTSTQNNPSCPAIYKTIVDDIDKWHTQLKDQGFTYTNLDEFKKLFGVPQTSYRKPTLYKWNNFTMLDYDKENFAPGTIGNFPGYGNNDAFHVLTINEAKAVLGSPSSTEQSIINIYSWRCDNNHIQVETNEQNKILSIRITDARNAEHNSFFDFSDVDKKFNELANKNSAEFLTEKDKKIIAKYNEHFKTNYTSINEVESDMIKMKQKAYDKVRHCITGNYESITRYNLPFTPTVIISEIYTVKGKDRSGNCNIEIIAPSILEVITQQQNEGTKILNCYFSSQDLNYFNNEQAKNDTIIKEIPQSESIISKSCKPKIIYPKDHQLQANIIPANFPKELVYDNKPIDPYCMSRLWDSTQSFSTCKMPQEISKDTFFENGNQSLLDQHYIGYTYRNAGSDGSPPYIYYKILNKISPSEFLVYVLKKDSFERYSFVTIVNRISEDQISGHYLTLPLPICTNSSPAAVVNADQSVTLHYKASLSQLLMEPLQPAFNEETIKTYISTIGPLKEEPHDLCMVNVDYNFGREDFYDFRNIIPSEIDKTAYSPQNIQYYECLKKIIKSASEKGPVNKAGFYAIVQTIKSQCVGKP